MREVLRFYSEVSYKYGQKLLDKNSNKTYVVKSCVNMEWLTNGDRKDFYLVIERVE